MSLLFALLIVCLIFGLVYYIVSVLPLPPPFKNIALVIVGVIGLVYLLGLLLGGVSVPAFNFK